MLTPASLTHGSSAPGSSSDSCTVAVISAWYPSCQVHADNQAQHVRASQLRQGLLLSYWDSLIVAAALDAGCTTPYSEDMQHGQLIDGSLSIVSPLLASPAA